MSLQRVALLLGPLMLLPAVASAQQGPRDRQTRSMVQTAMEDYQNLEIDRAVERLNLALRGCGTSNCSPGVLAMANPWPAIELLPSNVAPVTAPAPAPPAMASPPPNNPPPAAAKTAGAATAPARPAATPNETSRTIPKP